MKGRKPEPDGKVIPMRGDIRKPVPAAPEFLTDEARRIWDELAPILTGQDRLRPEFTYQFAAYCEQVARFIESTAVIAIDGFWFETETRNGTQQKKTAAWGVQVEAIANMNRLSALFGLSPVDAARLANPNQGDLFAELMNQLQGGDGNARASG